jgi:hypothetical protein
MDIVRIYLKRDSSDTEINTNIYSESIEFVLNESDYNHHGSVLDRYAVTKLNALFENKAKTLMRSWCAAQYNYGLSAVDAVKAFQEKFGFSEEIWKAETIMKDCQRNNVFLRDISNMRIDSVHKIVLSHLSEKRTRSQNS